MLEPYSHQTPMTLGKRSTPISPSASTRDLKQRVITCLNKLADRDTYTIAVAELESIAQNLSHDSLQLYLNCIYYTDSTQKSTVRKQCARLLGFLAEIHGDALSPHVSKMIGNVIRRLRDSDSSVRTVLVDTVSVMVARIDKVPFAVFLKPLMEAVSVEQDQNAQIGSALCLASAIEGRGEFEGGQLQRVVVKAMKLLKSESFKGKAALLTLVTSVVGVGGGLSVSLLGNLVPYLVEFLTSEDWAARKASAEALERLAVMEREAVSEYKSSYLSIFEARKFDKVKLVREAMTNMLEAWKNVPDVSNEVSAISHSKSSSQEYATNGRFERGSRSSVTPQSRMFKSPRSRLIPPDRASAATSRRERSPRKISENKSTPALFRKLDRKKPANWKVEIAVPHTPPPEAIDDGTRERQKVPDSGDKEDNRLHKPEARRALFNRNSDAKMQKSGGLKSGSRVVPLQRDEFLESTVVANNNTDDLHGNLKSSQDLSLIRNQLVQIENQQSSLLDLIQKFMGSSQNGMQSLETRVHGLEVALDEISYDLAVSTGRISNPEYAANSCCMLPGAEFLSSKFWRKTEERYSTSRFSSSLGTPLRGSVHNIADRDRSADSLPLDSRRFRHQSGGGLVVNPLADISSRPREGLEFRLNRLPKAATHEGRQVSNSSVYVASPAIGV